ncbi:N-acetylglucosaminyl-diphospho-decaprenol L-rhamnosyltransferase [Methylococcales bacterium]|nr:N-acetylglucosaminyl-diphospho-decaprenol L-rhamnosyltransferase [Methylococcales bacterium]
MKNELSQLKTTTSSVDIIILNWNGADDTIECIGSIEKSQYRNFRIIVVDNGSSDDSIERIKNSFSNVILIETGQNLGYAEGNNVGLRYALEGNPDYILVLNNDTIVQQNMIGSLVETAAKYPNSVLGPLTYYHDQPKVIWWAGTIWLADQLSFTHRGEGQIDQGDNFTRISECDYVVGSALFASSSIFQQIGLFDARFFLTFEETDWCYRAKKLGYRCYCVPQAQLWHKVSSTMGSGSPLQHYFYMRNALLWAERYLDKMSYLKLLRKSAGYALSLSIHASPNLMGKIKNAYWASNGLINRITGHSAHPISRANYLGLRDYILRHFGDCPDEIRNLAKPKREG